MTTIPKQPLRLVLPEKKTGGVSICLFGSTRSGKTTLLTHILDEYFKKHLTILMSASIHAPIYDDIKGVLKSPMYSPKLLHEAYEINRKTNNQYPFLFLLDDVVDKKNDKELLKLLTIYRNSGLSTIISLQSPVLMNTAGRGNINFVCLGKMNSDENIEKIVRMYLMSYLSGTISEKIREYKLLTEDHNWFMVDNLVGEVYRFKIQV
jgi:hypothetical protein